MIDIVEAIQCRVALKTYGPNGPKGSYVALCPFHEEKTPSFMVDSGRQEYHCLGCGARGNSEEFIKKFDEAHPKEEWTREEAQEKCDQMVLLCRERGLNITCIPYQSEKDSAVISRLLISRVDKQSEINH